MRSTTCFQLFAAVDFRFLSETVYRETKKSLYNPSHMFWKRALKYKIPILFYTSIPLEHDGKEARFNVHFIRKPY
jgi:hypothetical protein